MVEDIQFTTTNNNMWSNPNPSVLWSEDYKPTLEDKQFLSLR